MPFEVPMRVKDGYRLATRKFAELFGEAAVTSQELIVRAAELRRRDGVLSTVMSACVIAWIVANASAQSDPAKNETMGSPCDPTLTVRVDQRNELRYKPRGNTCEGLFIEELGGRELDLVSFASSITSFDVDADPSLTLIWSTPAVAPVKIRAHSLENPPFYRMDATGVAGTGSLAWSTKILKASDVMRIGVTASLSLQLGKRMEVVFLPLDVVKDMNAVRPRDKYELIFVSDFELSNAHVGLAEVSRDGVIKHFGVIEASGGPNGVERIVRMEILAPEKDGLYYIEVGAERVHGGTVAQSFFFYHRRVGG